MAGKPTLIFARIREALARIEAKVDQLLIEKDNMMATLSDVEAKVAELEADVTAVAEELRALSATNPKMQELADRLESVHASLQGAVVDAKHAAGM